ncbi:MAG TPA: aldo/keto reductase [Gemmatimonadales bacterium]|nr:aldo/keto reductase [Gemmatimonadales bacterium]
MTIGNYLPAANRYDRPEFFRRCGRSGVLLPVISLGLWHNFGAVDDFENARAILRRAFDAGITHFDLANNYGPPEGSAEATFGRILREDFKSHRDELIITTKAGYYMWPGPYGEWGSRKSVLASLDQSLARMGLDYVDIFYSHRPDPQTPLEETMGALAQAVKSGRALYAGLSNYSPAQTVEAARLLRDLGTPCLVHQPRYSMLDRRIEPELLATLAREQIGAVVFSPLAKGLLTDRYFGGIPADSRAGHDPRFLKPADISEAVLARTKRLNEIARGRGQSLAQMALAWVLRHPEVTSALIGASRPGQVDDCVGAAKSLAFAPEELQQIDTILAG